MLNSTHQRRICSRFVKDRQSKKGFLSMSQSCKLQVLECRTEQSRLSLTLSLSLSLWVLCSCSVCFIPASLAITQDAKETVLMKKNHLSNFLKPTLPPFRVTGRVHIWVQAGLDEPPVHCGALFEHFWVFYRGTWAVL